MTWNDVRSKYGQYISDEPADGQTYDATLSTHYQDYSQADRVLSGISNEIARQLRPTNEGVSSLSGTPRYHITHEGRLIGAQIKVYLVTVIHGGGEIYEVFLKSVLTPQAHTAMNTPRRFSVLFRTGTPDQQLLGQAMQAWLAAERQKNSSLTYDPGGQTEFEVIPHFFDCASDAEFHECVRTNAEFMFERTPDTMCFHQGVVLWPSDQITEKPLTKNAAVEKDAGKHAPSPTMRTEAQVAQSVESISARNAAIMRLLIAMARADGKIDEREKDILRSFTARFGISNEEFQALAQDKSIVRIADLPSDRDEKLKLFAEIFSVAFADGVIAAKEQSLAEKVAKGLGLDGSDIKSCMVTASKSLSSRQPLQTAKPDTKKDREIVREAIALLDKNDYRGAARVLQSSEKLRRYADDCREITMSWQQGAVVGALQSELETL